MEGHWVGIWVGITAFTAFDAFHWPLTHRVQQWDATSCSNLGGYACDFISRNPRTC